MGLTAKSKPIGVYGALIHLYPQAFQRQYGGAMQQTFVDMLEEENSVPGRARIRIRALVDLPLSAIKEHVTNGRDIIMNRNTRLILISAILAVGIVGIASFWEGNLHSRMTAGVEKVTVSQLADAMRNDDFYSSYGDAAVLFSGKVINVTTHDNASLVTFESVSPYAVMCQFPKAVSYKNGQSVSVAAPAGSAERQSKSVLLHNCIEN